MKNLSKDEYDELLIRTVNKAFGAATPLIRLDYFLSATLGTNYQDFWIDKYIAQLKEDITYKVVNYTIQKAITKGNK